MNTEIKTREELIDLLESLRAVEVMARKGYAQDTITFNNFQIIDAIEQIKKEEDEHIRIIDELLAMLKKGHWQLNVEYRSESEK